MFLKKYYSSKKVQAFLEFCKKLPTKTYRTLKYFLLKLYKKSGLSRPMAMMLSLTTLLLVIVFAYKLLSGFIYYKMIINSLPSVHVSATPASFESWKPHIKTSGSIRAVEGINVSSEVAGIVQTIYFKPGTLVNKNDLLLELNADSEKAQLKSLEAIATLAKITYDRDKVQFKANAVSQSTLDADEADLKNKESQVVAQAAIIAKKIIQAPFKGKLGISNVNPGQYIKAGDTLVTLQGLDNIYVDFFIPQQMIKDINAGLSITLKTDTYPDEVFAGEITTVNPILDDNTRNIEVEATIENKDGKLLPGMFGMVEIYTGKPQNLLTLPQTAITYNPYGEIVYILTKDSKDKKNKKGEPIYIAKQTFVKVGETRGDQVSILSGLKEGDLVVTSGQLKLKNGMPVVINNAILPTDNPNPTPADE